ncbi:MAG: hypothetical protein MPJ22_07605, partial [Pirellulales bacterium]|nr:hypothetical protein [Pirellulales bacterium]
MFPRRTRILTHFLVRVKCFANIFSLFLPREMSLQTRVFAVALQKRMRGKEQPVLSEVAECK